jgi:GTP cyclohydrolase II
LNSLLKKQAQAALPSHFGSFLMAVFSESAEDLMPHIVLIHKDIDVELPVHVRIHSECVTGDLFASKRCDCGEQLVAALHHIEEQKGMLIYLRQEGRGIGLINKLKAYQLQEQGMDTIQANTHLGFEADARQYNDAMSILKHFNVQKIHLLTNNPLKINAFLNTDISVLSRVPIEIKPNEVNQHYFDVKKSQMGHFFR